MRIVVVNPAYDATLASPAALLDRYATLTGWSRAVVRAGAAVNVLQRFRADAQVERDGVRYRFLCDRGPAQPSVWWASRAVIDAALAASPDVVHVNGLGYPRLISGLKALAPGVAVVVQDHGGHTGQGRIPVRRRAVLRSGLGRADACLFTSPDQVQGWREAGVLRQVRVMDVVESSTEIRGGSREDARTRTGMAGAPAILWVGRLDANKDPLTIVAALESAMAELPRAHATFVYQAAPLEAAVRDRIARSPSLSARVTLVGAVPHDRMADYYSSADVFVSASHAEGSGYALIEALACGVTPVVSDIPPFRAIAGEVGARFSPGDAAACATALVRIAGQDRAALSRAARSHFDTALTWDVIGRRALSHYRTLTSRRRL